jgi:PAS domain S-box-containing protein
MSAELLIRLPDYFPSLINAMQDGFVLRGTDGTILEANTAFCTMVGLDRAEIIGSRPPHVWWPEEAHQRFEDVFARYLSGASSEDDLVYERRTGERFPALVTNAPLHDTDRRVIAYIGTVKDMTERVRAEERNRFQAALIDQVEAGVVATDASGTILLWNKGAEDLYGWPQDEVVGKSGQELLLGPDSEAIVSVLIGNLNRGEPWEGEIRIPTRDGRNLPVLMSASAVRDEQHRPAGIVGVIVDISARKRAEALMAALYALARTLSEAQTLRDGLRGTLDAFASRLDWQYAAFWIIDDRSGIARCYETWHAEGMNGPEFDEICFNKQFVRGTRLPGVAWETQRPAWISDYQAEGDLPRHPAFQAIGIGSALALPVQIVGHVSGIIEFLAIEAREPDPRLLESAESIGSQVGQFIERRRVENALRESEDRFRTMANSAPVLLWVTDADGRFDWFNNGWIEYTGRTMEQEIGDGWTAGIHPDDRERCLATIKDAFSTRQPFEMEFRLRHHDGQYCWVVDRGVPRLDPDGTFSGFTGSCLDISDRKRHEEQQAFLSEATELLASSLDYHETLTNVARLAVPTIADWCVVHAVGDDGVVRPLAVTHVNPDKVAWAIEIQQRYPTDPDAPGGVPNVIRTGQPLIMPHITDEMIVASARDKEHLDLIRKVGFTSAMAVPIIARERVLGVIALVSAESGKRYNDDDLQLAQHLAQRAAVAIDNALLYRDAQKAAEARDQVLAVAAHELRSPLTSMKGFAQLLLRRAQRLPGGSEWVTPLQTIDTQVNRVTALVSRLLDVSRIEEQRLQLQAEPVDMVEVVRSAAVEAQLATELHTIVARFDSESLTASIDRTRVEQVLANLLDNAIKFSPESSTIEVVLQASDDDVVISVSDRGPGIPEDARERMFERYFRGTASTRAASEGLGLGLYVAHGIITAHGGRMWVDSEVDIGTTFSFTLPLSPRNDDGVTQPATGTAEA